MRTKTCHSGGSIDMVKKTDRVTMVEVHLGHEEETSLLLNKDPPTIIAESLDAPVKENVNLRRQLAACAKTLTLCTLWMCIGPTLILLNKHILRDLENSSGGKGFNYPMFLSGLGVLTVSLVSWLLVRVFKVVKLQHESKIEWNFYMTTLVPIAVCSAGTLAFGNWVYMFLSVSFIQMLKAFTPAMVLAVGSMTGVEHTTSKVVGATVGICIGTAIASAGEVNFSSMGLAFFLFSALAESIRLILTQHLLKNLKFGIIEGHFWLGPPGVMCLFGASMVMEMPRMIREDAFMALVEHPGLFVAAASLGLAVQFLTFMVVQVTGSVTLKVLGTARNAALVVFSVYAFREVVTPVQLLGYLISLGFFALYSYFKSQAN